MGDRAGERRETNRVIKQCVEFALDAVLREVNDHRARFGGRPIRRDDLSLETEQVVTKMVFAIYKRGKEGRPPPRPASIPAFTPPDPDEEG